MYKIKNTTSDYLSDNGFKEIQRGIYRLKFPISFYKKNPVVFCVATVIPEEGKRITLEVEKENGVPYELWYNTEYDQLAPKFRKELSDNIHRKMHKIGARRYEDR